MNQQPIGKKSPSDKHKEILHDFTFNTLSEHQYSYGRARRMISQKVSPKGIKIPKTIDEKVSKSGITVYPELLEFIFQVDGIYKKLLFYLMFYCVKSATNRFIFNSQIVSDFNKFCSTVSGKAHKPDIVMQGLRRLVKLNLIQNEKKGIYMLNPLIGIGFWKNKRVLISQYSTLLYKKGKDPMITFYPKNIEQKDN